MDIQIRENKIIIDGYVNSVERFSKILSDKNGKFIEKIMPTVFQRAIEKNDSIKVLLNHNYDRELANTKDGTAELYEDNIGLRAKVEITDEEVIEDAKNNKLRGWSFGFICKKKDEKTNENGIIERTVRDIDLMEVSILNSKKVPAYVGTSIEMRDGEVREIEFRTTEIEENQDVNISSFSELTYKEKRDILSMKYHDLYKEGYIEDFDDNYIYASIDYGCSIYKMPYSVSNGTVMIDTTQQIKVIRSGYVEVRNKDNPKQEEKLEKIDYSNYEKRIKKLKEENK